MSIRVVPDTNQFRRELKAKLKDIENDELKIPVGLDLDDAAVRAQLKELEKNHPKIKVDLNLDTAGLRAKLAALDRDSLNIKVGLDLANGELARLEAGLATLGSRSPKVDISVNVRGGALAVSELAFIESLVDRLDGRTINIGVDVDAGAAIAQIAAIEAALAGLQGTLGTINAGGGGGGGAFGGMARSATLAAAAIAAAAVVAPLLAIAGAAITAAWGAAAVSIAAIPALVALIGVPLGLLLLDMEQLGKSLKKVTPAFQAFKKEATAALTAGLAPALETIALKVLPQVRTQLLGVVTTLGQMAQGAANFLASMEGAKLLGGVFDNVTRALNNMKVGLGDIGTAFLIMANQAGAFDVLTTAVNTFGAAFKASVVDLVGDGTMTRAFQGLETVVASLMRGFVQLVDNGIRVFAAAAPGVTQFLDSLTGFFERFNWDALGRSVSNVFSGIAQTLDKIPQGTIDGIVAAFERLGAVFQNSMVQDGFASMAAGVEPFIQAMSDITFEIGHVASIITGFNTVLQGLGMQLSTVGRIFSGDFMNSFGQMDWGAIADAFAQGEAKVREGNRQLQTAFADGGAQAGAAGQRAIVDMGGVMKSATQEAFLGIGEAATTGSAAGFRAAEEASKGEAGRVGKTVQAELAKIPEQATQALNGLGPAVQQSFTGLSANVTEGMAGMNQAVIAGALQLQTAMATGLQGLGLAVQGGFAALAPFVTTGMLGMQTAVISGALQLQTTMAVGLQGLGLAVQAGFTALAPFAAAGMLAIQQAVVAGTLQIQTAMTIGMLGLNLAVTAGFAGTALAAQVGMQALVVAVIAGVLQVQAAMAVGMAGLNLAVTAGFAGTAAAATFGMLGIVAAVTVGMAAAAVAVTAGMLLMQSAVVAGMLIVQTAIALGMAGAALVVASQGAAMAAAMTAAMAALTAAAQAGMVNMQALIVAAFAGAVAAVVAGVAQMVASVQNGMAAMVAAVQAGTAAFVAAFRNAIAAAVAACNAAVGQFRAAGANMGQALADGLNSKVGAVQAAASRLAAAAAAATRAAAQIRSPSRVFMGLGDLMGQGLAVGLESSETHLIKAARNLVDGVSSEFSKIDASITPDMDAWASQLDAGVRRSVVETNPPMETVSAGGGVPLIGQITVNNPVEERASNSIARKMRDLAEVGVLARG